MRRSIPFGAPWSAVLVLATLPCLASPREPGADTADRARAVVRRLLARHAPERLRGPVLRPLDPFDAPTLVEALRDLVRQPRYTAGALHLAGELALGGLGPIAEAFLDSHYEVPALRLMLRTQSERSLALLVARWESSDTTTEAYARLTAALLSHRLRAHEALERLRAHLEEEGAPRRDDAARILAYQLAREPSSPEALSERWPQLSAAFLRDARSPRRQGTDLLADRMLPCEAALPRGESYRLPPRADCWLRHLPEEIQTGDWRIACWVQVEEGEGQRLSLVLGGWLPGTIEVAANRWQVRFGSATARSVPVRAGRWVLVEAAWRDATRTGARRERRVRVAVDGEVLLEGGLLPGRIDAIRFQAGEGGLLVGALGYGRLPH